MPSPTSDPIAKLARLFNSKLVDVEDRIETLDGQLSTYAKHVDYALKTGLGYRGYRSHAGAADPSITLDLGAELPISTIFLIPAQREMADSPSLFPLRFTLELSNQADFGQRSLVFTTGAAPYPPTNGVPTSFKAKETARYVRMTVQEGHRQGALDLFSLAEIIVVSKGEPVSFGATVTTVGAFDASAIWYPAALTDGRTPLGIWQHGSQPKINSGDAVSFKNPDEPTTWTVPLDAAAPLDYVVLFPYQSNPSPDLSVFPEMMALRLDAGDGTPAETVFEWTNPLPGTCQMSPMVIPLHGKPAATIHLIATRPSIMGNHQLHALSEIEIWSRGKNLAAGRKVMRDHPGQAATLTSLTDGYTSDEKIIPVAFWLQQLQDRDRIERELGPLKSVQRQLATNSELNTTWGASMILGLMFLIPVFIVERRRLMTQDQLDQIRKRISADLHDDIGSNLGSISLIARTARKDLLRLQGPPTLATDLAEMETIARESSLAMRDIVWLLERRQDSVGDLVQRMRATAGRLLREIQFTLECESQNTTAKLSLDAKRHLFLFYKESIHNILKHSQADRVSIRLWDEAEHLCLEILDNGIGIPMTEQECPAAVNKLEDRARLLKGVLQITSAKDSGTRIHLMVKRSHLTHSFFS